MDNGLCICVPVAAGAGVPEYFPGELLAHQYGEWLQDFDELEGRETADGGPPDPAPQGGKRPQKPEWRAPAVEKRGKDEELSDDAGMSSSSSSSAASSSAAPSSSPSSSSSSSSAWSSSFSSPKHQEGPQLPEGDALRAKERDASYASPVLVRPSLSVLQSEAIRRRTLRHNIAATHATDVPSAAVAAPPPARGLVALNAAIFCVCASIVAVAVRLVYVGTGVDFF